MTGVAQAAVRTVGGDPGEVLRAEAACLLSPWSVGKGHCMSPLSSRPQVPVGGNLWALRSLFRAVGSEPGLSVLPQAARRKGCLKLWRGCTEPGGVLACPAPTLLNQLKKTFLHRVRGKYPGQLEIGNSPSPQRRCPASPGFSDATAGLTAMLAAPECLHGIKHDCKHLLLGRTRGL